MAKAKITLEAEFETDSEAQATAALIRAPGGLRNIIEHGSASGIRTGVKGGSVKVTVTSKTIDGKPAT